MCGASALIFILCWNDLSFDTVGKIPVDFFALLLENKRRQYANEPLLKSQRSLKDELTTLKLQPQLDDVSYHKSSPRVNNRRELKLCLHYCMAARFSTSANRCSH